MQSGIVFLAAGNHLINVRQICACMDSDGKGAVLTMVNGERILISAADMRELTAYIVMEGRLISKDT
jgi:hypothetical protein